MKGFTFLHVRFLKCKILKKTNSNVKVWKRKNYNKTFFETTWNGLNWTLYFFKKDITNFRSFVTSGFVWESTVTYHPHGFFLSSSGQGKPTLSVELFFFMCFKVLFMFIFVKNKLLKVNFTILKKNKRHDHNTKWGLSISVYCCKFSFKLPL